MYFSNQRTGEYKESDAAKTLACRDYKSATDLIMRGGYDINGRTQNKVLCILWETYGKEEVVKWGTTVLDTLQQAEVLRHRVHESSFSHKTENWNKLESGTLPCPTVVAEWLLRDMWEQQKCGCTPQGWESAEQQFGELTEAMSELPYKGTQNTEKMFDMWSKGKGIGILRQALSEIQKIRKSENGVWKGGDGMNGAKTVVRRLTPL